ncbi:MAG: YCF48-related protein [Candidatus Margulisiibacteriota bacterium]
MRKICLSLLCLALLVTTALAGERWVSQASPTTRGLYAVDAVNNSPRIAYAAGDRSVCLRTTSSGASWEITQTETFGNYLAGISFPSATVGYAGGAFIMADPNLPLLYKTTDGAGTWAPLSAPANATNILDLFFSNENRGWVAVNDTITTNRVHRTDDGGSSWTPKVTGLNATKNYYGLYFLNDTDGFLVGETGLVYLTKNAGESWSQAAIGVTTSDLNDVYFADIDHGWAVGNAEALLRTTDGGTNWTAIDVPFLTSDHTLSGVYFLDNNTGWVVGWSPSGPVLIKSLDGGVTWTAETLPAGVTSGRLYDVNFGNQYNGWAVGEGSSFIFKYVVDPTISNVRPTARFAGWTGLVTFEAINALAGMTFEAVKSGGSGVTVSFATVESVSPTLIASLLITAEAAATTGDWTLYFRNPDGGVSTAAFTVNPIPAVSTVTRAHPIEGNTNWDRRGALRRIAVTGGNFQAGAVVSFSGSGVTVSAATLESATTLEATIAITEAADLGWRDVTVTNPDGGTATLASAFQILPNSVGPTITGAAIAGAVDASSKKLPISAWPPRISCTLEDLTGLTAATVNFKVILNSPVAYYSSFAGETVFTPDAADPTHKGTIAAVLRNVKVFTSEVVTDAYPIFGSPVDVYFYAEDRDSNPTLQLYDTVYVEGAAAPARSITSVLVAPNRRPTPADPAAIQFLSTDLEGTLDIYFMNVMGGASRKISTVVTKGLNKVNFDGLDLMGHLISNGMYKVNFVYGGRSVGSGLMMITR